MAETLLKIENLTKEYEGQKILDGIHLEVKKGDVLVVVGPSGCGKSTLLRCINALEPIQGGTIKLQGMDIRKGSKNITTLRQKIGMVFQKPNPFPMSIYDNIAYGPRTHGIKKKSELDEIVERSLKQAAIWDEVKDRLKKSALGMSGGQQQRVAIARALVKLPRVLLLDEPLSNLDARLRLQTREEIRRIQQETQITTIFVTHDQDEAMSISDMIVVMKDGIVQQIGKPQNVYDDPVNLFVAKFLGTPPINVFSGEVKNEQLYIGYAAVLPAPGVADQPVHVGIRPEGFILKEDGPLSCDLVRLEVMGRDVSIVSTHEKSQNVTIRSIIDADEGKSLPTGKVHFGLKPAKVFLFCTDTEERIRF